MSGIMEAVAAGELGRATFSMASSAATRVVVRGGVRRAEGQATEALGILSSARDPSLAPTPTAVLLCREQPSPASCPVPWGGASDHCDQGVGQGMAPRHCPARIRCLSSPTLGTPQDLGAWVSVPMSSLSAQTAE